MEHVRKPQPANRLGAESSPYLRQHANNPVDWYPWGTEALQRAQREHKPILLSIGYAACHWCHVMAHESFEDEATAALMNELYVNIKVDREERPDLDRVYQLAHQMLTGRGGGWPLTMFLMHDDQRPFFGGTYFPDAARYGMPAFRELLQAVSAHYRIHEQALRQPAAQIAAALSDLNPRAANDVALHAAPLQVCRESLEHDFDGRYGGFGGAPKFPHPPSITRLLRAWHATAATLTPDLQALYMATLSLTRMGEGGLFDQLGGGFYRYSVDERWEIPHFEKMLYDNAQLLPVYAEAAIATGEPLFRAIAERSGEWMLADMRGVAGAFYSSLDADSEGHEGRYYVWSDEQARQLLQPAEWRVLAARFGFDRAPNFEGQWHLTVAAGVDPIAEAQQLHVEEVQALLAQAAQKLLAARSRRVRPGLDDKILTSWNALTVRGLAIAARALGRADFAAAATAALQYLHATHFRDGRLLATSHNGNARLSAYLDDHVFLIDAILELNTVRFCVDELQFAITLMDNVLQHFEDAQEGGFYFTADDHEALIARPKSFGDEALPAGNAIATQVLLRLGYLLGEPRYLTAAERALRAAWPALIKYPQGHAAMLNALDDYLHPQEIVLLRGPQAQIAPWQQQLAVVYQPRRWVLAIANEPNDVGKLPPAIASKAAGAQAVAYVCRGTRCSAPLASFGALLNELKADVAA